jgi:hypothetical protein
MLDDITCSQADEHCPNVERYTAGTAVARLTVDALMLRTPSVQKQWSCTGFLVAFEGRRDLILTAGHCIRDFIDGEEYRAWRITAEFGAEYGVGVVGGKSCACERPSPPALCGTPNANDCDNPQTACSAPQSSRILAAPNAWWRDCKCDWGLVRLAGPAPAGSVALTLADTVPGGLEVIGHPDGRCKEISYGTRLGTLNSCLETAEVDTLGGSSGSPVLRPPPAGTREVVGINVAATRAPQGGGVCPNYYTPVRRIAPKLAQAVAVVGAPGAVADATDPDTFCIPAVSQWGLVVMGLLVASTASVVIIRRRLPART